MSESFDALYARIRSCKECGLCEKRIKAVPGEGPQQVSLMLIGEGPGMNEDKQGRPFVGASGQFLTELIGHAGFKREEVYITNVVKCRPPNNRDPLPEEIAACAGYLQQQIEMLNPGVIVTLGRFSMAKYFPNEKISAIHGQSRKIDGRVIVPMYHPAAALHQPALRATLVQDFGRLKELIAQAQGVRVAKPKPDAPSEDDDAQLKLFQ